MESNMNIVFMGTPDFAVGALEAIIREGYQVSAVVTQPDKPKGRGKELQCSPVKECALQHGIEVFQPTKIKSCESVEQLRKYQADIFVVAAFGQILSSEILYMPKYGSVCIHASLLPKYRGAAPINWAIIDGEKESGVTIMQMDEGIDTGAMLLKRVVPIEPKETAESLFHKLAHCGADLIVEALPLIENGKTIPIEQNEQDSCYAKMLKKEIGFLDFHMSAVKLERLIRGLNSWPCAYTYYKGKTLKIWDADWEPQREKGEPGTVAYVTKEHIGIYTREGILILNEVQLEGKRRMQVKDFLLGNQIVSGEAFKK